jgi:hypothetical protein
MSRRAPGSVAHDTQDTSATIITSTCRFMKRAGPNGTGGRAHRAGGGGPRATVQQCLPVTSRVTWTWRLCERPSRSPLRRPVHTDYCRNEPTEHTEHMHTDALRDEKPRWVMSVHPRLPSLFSPPPHLPCAHGLKASSTHVSRTRPEESATLTARYSSPH